MKDTDKEDLKEIGIRGDCVYAVYSTPNRIDLYDVADRAFHINTYMKMLNKLLSDRGLPSIKAGIGLAASETLTVKAGRKHSGINNLVWIGESVATAAKLSDLGNKDGVKPIVMSSVFYSNYIEIQKERNSVAEEWWTSRRDTKYGGYWHGNVVKIEFNDWIVGGMKD